MTRRVTVAQIEADVADYVRAAEDGDTVLITRNGRAVVALVPAGEGYVDLPTEGLIGLAGGWEGSDELVERIAEIRRSPAAILHGLELVTGNLRHFGRVPGLRTHRALADSRPAE
jgi:prevent-host-death family protein